MNHAGNTLNASLKEQRISVQRNGMSAVGESEDPFKFNETQIGLWTGFGLETKLSNKLTGLIDLRYEFIPAPTQQDEMVQGIFYNNLLIMIGIKI